MGVRKGQGYGVPKPKRAPCPECGKKGVSQWHITPSGAYRECQYCRRVWGVPAWNLAMATGSTT